jgi:hypothetical protein
MKTPFKEIGSFFHLEWEQVYEGFLSRAQKEFGLLPPPQNAVTGRIDQSFCQIFRKYW